MTRSSLVGISALIGAVALACAFSGSAFAADPTPQPSLCATDSPLCRSLAIGVAKSELADSIHRDLDRRRAGSFLCAEDNPDCCPPELMPYCSRVESDLVSKARRSLGIGSGSMLDNPCLWSEFLCDQLKDGRFSVLPFDPDPVVICPCGYHDNGRGQCIESTCYGTNGIRIPCKWGCELLEERTEHSAIARHLRDGAIQLEAAEQLRDELSASLEAVEAKLGELAQYAAED